ncbi:MAG: SMI1/KNR4 family protein [Lachnospiraceae bacterium]|nr:SMI1/KNR4 family protein [Lachnospiraceae bacterium]
MASFIEALEAKEGIIIGAAASARSIAEAERELGLSFADEYREYLSKFGIAAINAHEFTGITKSARTNVVQVTIAQRARHLEIPKNLYVVEETDVEEVVIWQGGDGRVFYSSPNQPPAFLCSSLRDYISHMS